MELDSSRINTTSDFICKIVGKSLVNAPVFNIRLFFSSLKLLSLQLEHHRFLPFGIMAGLALGAAVFCMTLPETHNKPTLENLKYDPEDQLINEKDELKTAKDGEDEGTPL